MKITNSAVAMTGQSRYSSYQETEVKTLKVSAAKWKAFLAEQEAEQQETGDDVSISDQGQSLYDKYKEKQAEQQKKNQENLVAKSLQQTQSSSSSFVAPTKEDQTLTTLKRVLEMLRRLQKGEKLTSYKDMVKEINTQDAYAADSQFGTTANRLGISQSFSLSGSISVVDLRSAATTTSGNASSGVGSLWVRHTESSSFVMEQESTSFSTTGIAKTEDGREISFGLELTMSRGFAGTMFSSTDEEYIMTDPLVINLEGNTASVSDQKFYFDLDSDGKQEQISSLGQGSGFLAYDKNGDGVINDGSELFGTQSGDGFRDLAAYDEDGNGWIDENDSIFQNLKVWTKNEDGTDRLLDLKEANVGAIYLGSANTQFHLNDAATNQTNAMIQKTGIFLRETGEVGTIQHVDLAV